MYDFLQYQVQDVMTPEPMCVTEKVSIGEAVEIFDQHDFNGLPVIDENGRLIGMVTKLDALKAFVFTPALKVPPYQAIMAKPVSTIMNQEVMTVEAERPLTRVLSRMIESRFKSFPVVDDDGVVTGVVSREDVLRALHRSAEGLLPERVYPTDAR